MICNCCLQEMTDLATLSCESDVDTDVIAGDRRCPDCNVAPGGQHHPGCDMERCSICMAQVIMGCPHSYEAEDEIHDGRDARWAGLR